MARSMLWRWLSVSKDEVSALCWSWLYFFCLLAAYYIIRPIRDEMGIAGGTQNLPWLFTATLLVILALNLPFVTLVKKFPRLQLINYVYRFFILNLLVFVICIMSVDSSMYLWVGRIFFVWTSVFNLFVVSVFWMLMVDIFNSDQGQRLFGIISAGGTLGGIAGSAFTALAIEYIPPVTLLLVAAGLLEITLICVRHLSLMALHKPTATESVTSGEEALGGSLLAGFTNTIKNPYLLCISLYVLLFTITSTTLYFQQAEIVKNNFTTSAERSAALAQIDLWVNVLTLISQMLLTSRLMSVFGVAFALAIMPVITFFGFSFLAIFPTMFVLTLFQAVRRAGEFSIARPTREVLFTVLAREDKYKAKSFIDTAVYRTGDQLGAWSQAMIQHVGLGATGTAVTLIPVIVIWLGTGIWLGYRHKKLSPAIN